MKVVAGLGRTIVVIASLYGIYSLILPVQNLSKFSIHQVDNIAHQGGNLEFPDSTLKAYDEAVNNNADVLEADVHLTNDGHLVVIHDASVNRTTNGKGAVRDYNLRELKALDAAYWWPYHNEGAEQRMLADDQAFPYRGTGLHIVTLEELFQRYPHHRFTIELKDNSDELREALASLIETYERWESTLVASFYLDTLQALRASHPRAQTYAGESEIKLFYVLQLLRLEKLYPHSVDAFAIPMRSGSINLATPRFVQAAHNAGILVHYWTINEESDMRYLLEIGADGIMTDRPSLLNALQTGRTAPNLL